MLLLISNIKCTEDTVIAKHTSGNKCELWNKNQEFLLLSIISNMCRQKPQSIVQYYELIN